MPTDVALVVLLRGSHVLLQRRERAPSPGAWELPGGKVLPGEEPADAAAREAREELGVPVRILAPLGVHEHRYPGGPHVRLHAFRGEADVPERDALRWVPLRDLPALDVLAGTRPVLELLRTEVWRANDEHHAAHGARKADAFRGDVARAKGIFFAVLHTTERTQTATMTIPPGQEAGPPEVHEDEDQVFLFLEGEAEMRIWEGKTEPKAERHGAGSIVVVPAGVKHWVKSVGKEPLLFFTVYGPPAY